MTYHGSDGVALRHLEVVLFWIKGPHHNVLLFPCF